ncbi:MAG: asparagine synthase-related protein [Actinomycetota bacterium]|nr:asparagine synthase-related protein [Actinomycetota bacterium]
MSGIGGVVRVDGGAVDPSDVAFLIEGMRHRGPDGIGDWRGEGVALVQALLRATPEAPLDAQPLADETGTLRVVFDGRLDNRDELRRALDGAGCRLRSASDAEILLQAYRRWERGCISRLIGDFAFALWDGRHSLLFCGRDPLGMKPFVYRTDGRRLVWASELRPIALLPGASSRPNLGMIAELLASNVTSRDETVWDGVLRLPPAHTLTVEGGRIAVSRYWDLEPGNQIRHISHEEYADHLREVLTVAVRDRMRTVGPSVVELSGGIDSSALLGLAMNGHKVAPSEAGLEAVSLVYPGRDCDESMHIDAVADFWEFEPTRVLPVAAGTFDYEAQARTNADVPAYPAVALWDGLYAAVRGLGARSTLNGIGGDEWFTGTAVHVADLLRAGRFRELSGFVRGAAAFEERSAAAVIWYYGFRSLAAHSLWRPISEGLRSRVATRRAPWVTPGFATSVGLRDRLLVPERRNLTTIAQGQICHTLDGGILTNSCEFVERFAANYGLELRLPFLDVRVLEFALAIPEAERWGSGMPKRVLRSAVRGLAPDSVLDRLDKQGPSFISAEQLLSPETAACLRSPVIEREGWVDGNRLRAMHAEMAGRYRRSDPGWDAHIWPLWRAVAVELWLRAHRLG